MRLIRKTIAALGIVAIGVVVRCGDDDDDEEREDRRASLVISTDIAAVSPEKLATPNDARP